MKKRLTIKAPSGLIHLTDDSKNGLNQAFKKLAKYETAEEEGRLVVLPCKVGDTVYLILNTDDFVNPIISCKIRQIIIRDYGTLLSLFSTDEMIGHTDWYPIEDIGVKIFLTREEAEKALKEMEGKS